MGGGDIPRAQGSFVRRTSGERERELIVGHWGFDSLVRRDAEDDLLDQQRPLRVNRDQGFLQAVVAARQALRHSGLVIRRTLLGEGPNVWWSFRRADCAPWGLEGLWSDWLDKKTGEVISSYTMMTINADDHFLMSRMDRADLKLPPDRQDQRSVVAIDFGNVDAWLHGSADDAASLMRVPSVEVIEAAPKQ